MTYVLAILGCAALFALFGYTRPASRCTGSCGMCTHACPSYRDTPLEIDRP